MSFTHRIRGAVRGAVLTLVEAAVAMTVATAIILSLPIHGAAANVAWISTTAVLALMSGLCGQRAPSSLKASWSEVRRVLESGEPIEMRPAPKLWMWSLKHGAFSLVASGLLALYLPQSWFTIGWIVLAIAMCIGFGRLYTWLWPDAFAKEDVNA